MEPNGTVEREFLFCDVIGSVKRLSFLRSPPRTDCFFLLNQVKWWGARNVGRCIYDLSLHVLCFLLLLCNFSDLSLKLNCVEPTTNAVLPATGGPRCWQTHHVPRLFPVSVANLSLSSSCLSSSPMSEFSHNSSAPLHLSAYLLFHVKHGIHTLRVSTLIGAAHNQRVGGAAGGRERERDFFLVERH